MDCKRVKEVLVVTGESSFLLPSKFKVKGIRENKKLLKDHKKKISCQHFVKYLTKTFCRFYSTDID